MEGPNKSGGTAIFQKKHKRGDGAAVIRDGRVAMFCLTDKKATNFTYLLLLVFH